MELQVKLLNVSSSTVNTRNGVKDKVNIEIEHDGKTIKASGFANSVNAKWKAEDVVTIELEQKGIYWNYRTVETHDDLHDEANNEGKVSEDEKDEVMKQLEFLTEVMISVHSQMKNLNRMVAKAGLMLENNIVKPKNEPDSHISRFKSNPAISKEVKESIDKDDKADKYDFLKDDDTLCW